MSGQSNVGNSGAYEAGDQRNYKEGEDPNQPERFHEGKQNSHLANDSKDQRSIANKLAHETAKENDSEFKSVEAEQVAHDATLPARAHGNEPSKGAKIDQQLREEEEEELRRKGKK
ncbi:hypothetical protein BCR34DRAFT_475588 [Clohesyomyces aquaticus]|uniref:Uncharacterized protein n=1 Tax=Clohesyomyces aquaticus TaxID=1231657 RepID=A0A1Y2A4F7_9PLEO|nr:hypothetical protein BCR34DRAFT_475588 [Clohesyomyces aquaticus]